MSLIIEYHRLKNFVREVIRTEGIPAEHAEIAADSLVNADLRGIGSHGVSRIPLYLKRIKLGLVNPNPNITIAKDSGTTMILDGDFGLGQVVANTAMKYAIRIAQKNNVAIVAVCKSNHFGTAAYYAMMALKEDMIGFVCSNTTPLMPAPSGTQKVVGNNPFAIAVPSNSEMPIVLDMACSEAALGKILLAKNQGKKIPETWATNNMGLPTTDPDAALQGFLLPIGGPKGYGLAVMIDILAGVLSGSSFGRSMTSIYKDFQNKQDCGHLFITVKISSLMEINRFKERIDVLIKEIKSSTRVQGSEEIYLPGEIEHRKMQKQIKEGISLDPVTYNELKEIAVQRGLDYILV